MAEKQRMVKMFDYIMDCYTKSSLLIEVFKRFETASLHFTRPVAQLFKPHNDETASKFWLATHTEAFYERKLAAPAHTTVFNVYYYMKKLSGTVARQIHKRNEITAPIKI